MNFSAATDHGICIVKTSDDREESHGFLDASEGDFEEKSLSLSEYAGPIKHISPVSHHPSPGLLSPGPFIGQPNFDSPAEDQFAVKRALSITKNDRLLIRVFLCKEVCSESGGFLTLQADSTSTVVQLKEQILEKLKQKRMSKDDCRTLNTKMFNLASKAHDESVFNESDSLCSVLKADPKTKFYELHMIADDTNKAQITEFVLRSLKTTHGTFLTQKRGRVEQCASYSPWEITINKNQGCVYLACDHSFLSVTENGQLKAANRSSGSRWFVEDADSQTYFLRSASGKYLTAHTDARVTLGAKGAAGKFMPIINPTVGFLKHSLGDRGKEVKNYFELDHYRLRCWKSKRISKNQMLATTILHTNQIEQVRPDPRASEKLCSFIIRFREHSVEHGSTLRALTFTAASAEESKAWQKAFTQNVFTSLSSLMHTPVESKLLALNNSAVSNSEFPTADDDLVWSPEKGENAGSLAGSARMSAVNEVSSKELEENLKVIREENMKLREQLIQVQDYMSSKQGEAFARLEQTVAESNLALCAARQDNDDLVCKLENMQQLLKEEKQKSKGLEASPGVGKSADELVDLRGDVPNVICQGWLKKKGVTSIQWQNRYFILTELEGEGGETVVALVYYKNLEHATEHKAPGVIELGSVTKVQVNTVYRWSKPFPSISMMVSGGRSYEMICPSVEEALAWQSNVSQYLPAGVVFEGKFVDEPDNSSTAQVDVLKEDIAIQKQQLQDMRRSITAQETAHEQAYRTVSKDSLMLQQKLDEARLELSELKDQRKQLLDELHQNKERFASADSGTFDSRQHLLEREHELEEMQARTRQFEQERETLHQATASLAERHAQERSQAEDYFTGEMAKLEKRIKQMSIHVEQLTKEKEQNTNQLARLENELGELKKDNAQLQTCTIKSGSSPQKLKELEAREKRLEERELRLVAKEQWLDEADRALDTQCKDFNRKIQEYNKRVISLNKRQAALKAQELASGNGRMADKENQSQGKRVKSPVNVISRSALGEV